MPTTLGPLSHLIGANMSVRRTAFERVKGFHSIDFDDLDMCMRLAFTFPDSQILFEPDAVVHHYVPAERVAWRYFWKRCFFVNRTKVETFSEMGSAANLGAEMAFVRRALTVQVRSALEESRSGESGAFGQLFAMLIGIFLAGLGNGVGQLLYRMQPHLKVHTRVHKMAPNGGPTGSL